MKTHAGMAPEEREYRMHLALMAAIIYAGALNSAANYQSPWRTDPELFKGCLADAHRLMAEAAVLPVFSCLTAPLE